MLRTRYNFQMRAVVAACLPLLLAGWIESQTNIAPAEAPRSVTVRATVDHNRIIIPVDIRLPDGSTQQIRAWVDNGNPELTLSRRVASLLALAVTCNDQECTSPPPQEIRIGGMAIPLTQVKAAKIPLQPVSAAALMEAGMNAEINIPSTALRHYDLLIDFPGRKFSIGQPGTLHFRGSNTKVRIAENGLIQVASQIENKKFNLTLDLGSTISVLSEPEFSSLAAAHPNWPHMTGAVSSANMWGADAETQRKVMRVDRVQCGPLFLVDLPVVAWPKTTMDFLEKRAGMAIAGLLGSDALMNYRVGLDYAHSTVYFEVGRTFNFPEFDVVGLVLRPEKDGTFTVLSAADLDGKASVPSGAEGVAAGDHLIAINDIPVRGSTMGQVWGMLRGTPGQQRKLTLERSGRQFAVMAAVQHFLAALPDDKPNSRTR